ncbi:MAG: sensor histidine kinase N-terminal domain-containing protein [Rhodoferax sp.]|nr:sensor histidine kinase N-terminal domain-containing protein [Rhodoferax sp.]MBP9930643.1 sensor histidine kinase N-terminal domain-containing protein [Rhodoferax sp.]HQZ07570.1 sensor histidine kinase N-terminal domain-containing protein [Burkholderiaceae bacterium]
MPEPKQPIAAHASRAGLSLRRYLLLGILLPTGLFMLVNTAVLYRQALTAVNTAYDRTLLASAKSIGELLEVEGEGAQAQFRTNVPYSALEAFEADNRSRMVYRISNVRGELIAGSPDLPLWQGRLPDKGPYAALVDFYDDTLRGDAVRVAVLLQPVASRHGLGVATIQVAETLELRRTLARQILLDTLLRQSLLTVVIALVVVLVVQRATRPVRELSANLRLRAEDDLTVIAAPGLPRELRPLVDATNQVMARLQNLLEHQKRFVRDASHQLRTPLAVLKVQVQSALRADVPPQQALHEINGTVERATVLANQMLALAKVEQLRQQADTRIWDLAPIMRAIALDLAPLMAERNLDFGIETTAAPIRAHEWMLRELVRNLLHNAIKHAPDGSVLSVRIAADRQFCALTVSDCGPGISTELRARLFQPFSAGHGDGSGLGLMICREIALALGGQITLDNRVVHGHTEGLDATVRLPLAGTT